MDVSMGTRRGRSRSNLDAFTSISYVQLGQWRSITGERLLSPFRRQGRLHFCFLLSLPLPLAGARIVSVLISSRPTFFSRSMSTSPSAVTAHRRARQNVASRKEGGRRTRSERATLACETGELVVIIDNTERGLGDASRGPGVALQPERKQRPRSERIKGRRTGSPLPVSVTRTMTSSLTECAVM